MATETHAFKRVVLGLQQGATDRTMRLAVELADLLHIELLGLFLHDTSLHDLAAMPFAREFRPLSRSWHAIDFAQLSQQLELAVSSSERIFSEAASRVSTRCHFEVIQGSTASIMESISRTGDIVLIVAPVSPAERATQQFSRLTESAFRSAAAVMFVPPRIVRSSGPIVAIAAAGDDPSVKVASAIARAANEEVVVIETVGGGSGEPAVREAETSRATRRIAHELPLSSPAVAASAFRDVQERLIIVSRGVLTDEAAMALASLRRIPVLVTTSSAGAAGAE